MTSEIQYIEDYLESYDDERPVFTCPMYQTYKTPNGKWKTNKMHCKDFRNCTICKNRRAKDIRTRVTTACARAEDVGQPWPQWQTMSEADASAFRQKLDRRGLAYYRLVVAGERVIIFHDHADEALGSRTVTVHDIAEEQGLDWERIAMTPLHKRTSGDLGRLVKDPRPEDAILVELLAAARPAYLTTEQVAACQAAADAKTVDLEPTVDDAIEACRLVTKALQEELEAAAVEYWISQGDDQATAQLNAFRDTPLTDIRRYWSPSSFEPWTRERITSTGERLDDNRSRYSTRAVPGVDFTPAPVELML